MSWLSNMAHSVSDWLNQWNPDEGRYDDMPISERPSAFHFKNLPFGTEPTAPTQPTLGEISQPEEPPARREPAESDWPSPGQLGLGPESGYTTQDGSRINPSALYYSPDQMVDAVGVARGEPELSPGIPDLGGFRGMPAAEIAHGFRPTPTRPVEMPSPGAGGAGGGPAKAPFSHDWQRPDTPDLQRPTRREWDMTDPYPPPEMTPAPEPYRRDKDRYAKLLGY